MIKIQDRLPENKKLVNVAYSDINGNFLMTMGWYCRKYEVEADYSLDEEIEYSQELDNHFLIEGWYSQCLESEYYYPIQNVSHWDYLPIHPLKMN